jgi:hypothetical protein
MNGNGNMANIRWQQIKKAKDCPAPRSEATIKQLALLLTHLIFRWTYVPSSILYDF